MIDLDEKITKNEFDSFVTKNELGSVLQSYDWNQIKSGWQGYHFGIRKNQQLIGTILLLERRLFKFFKIMYIPRGLVLENFQDKETLAEITGALHAFGKSKRALFIKFDPLFVLQKGTPKEMRELQEPDLTVAENLTTLPHVVWWKDHVDIDDTLQPRYQAVIYHPEPYDESCLNKKGRYYVKTARNRGIHVTKHTVDGLESFVAILEKTESRQNIRLRNKDYFKTILTTYPNAYIMLGHLNLTDRYQTVEAELSQAKEEFSAIKESSPKKAQRIQESFASKEKELKDLTEKMTLYGEGDVIVSGTLCIPYGQTNELLYAGMDEEFSFYGPAYVTWFESIAEGQRSYGCQKCNLGGVHASLTDGLTKYKNHFNPMIEFYIGEIDIVVKPLIYKLAIFGQNLLKKKR